jgi:hypothetical protein
MAEQMRAAAEYFHADDLALVDVGGDAVAGGDEPGLRSPLADFLALAAACRIDLTVQLLITGVELDGELTESEVLDRLDLVKGSQLCQLSQADFTDVRTVFDWHPSEANGLLAAAARGVRGIVETRDHGGDVRLTDRSTIVWRMDGRNVLSASPGRTLTETADLAEVEHDIRAWFDGKTEIDYERSKAERRSKFTAKTPNHASLRQLDRYVADVTDAGPDYLTVRRAAELLAATDLATIAELRRLLATHRAEHYDPPLYAVSPRPRS